MRLHASMRARYISGNAGSMRTCEINYGARGSKHTRAIDMHSGARGKMGVEQIGSRLLRRTRDRRGLSFNHGLIASKI